MTLTTGEVTLKDGLIDNINVGEGLIVSLDDLNINNINKVNILSKLARLEKDVISKNLEISTGNNVYSIDGENVEIVKTIEGEIGVTISANILGSVYGDNVKIIATKSGIGTKSIIADTVKLDSKTQANVEKILSNNVSIKVEEDFSNKDKIIANKSLDIEAKNIFNDGSLLISDKLNLKASQKISNTNGGLIHGDVRLDIKANNLDNIGKVVSFGDNKVSYIDISSKEKIEDISKWLTNQKETYNSYNALRASSTDEAKENALRAFYDEKVHIDPKEFDWRVYKNDYEAGENKKREGSKGKFFDKFTKEKLNLIKEANSKAMYSEYSDNYEDSLDLGKVLEGKVESKNKNTKFSVLSGNDINIEVNNRIDNKDGHIIANKGNNIRSNIFNNSSSISDKGIILQDGYERMNFWGSFDCTGAVACYIKHNAEHIRVLDGSREVFVKALPSYLKGENIHLNSNEVNFKAYKEDESKKALREEDEIYTNKKEEVLLNGKKIEYNIEKEPRFVSLKYFYNNPYFLDNIKYNGKYDPKEFEISDRVIKENEKEVNKVSNITINASKLNIEEQKLLFNNVKLSSNNILIKGAKLEAIGNLEVDKNDNIRIVASDIEVKENLLVKSNNVSIEDKIETTNKEKNVLLTNENGKVLLDKKENITTQTSISSNIKGKNIQIDASNVTLKGSNLVSDGNIDINAEKVNILNSVSNNTRKSDSISGTSIFKHTSNIQEKTQVSNGSNLLSNNLNINAKETNIQDSNVKVDNLNASGKLTVKADILNQEYIVKKDGIGYSIDNKVKFESAKGSTIEVVNNTNIDTLKLEGSKLESKDLIANNVEVNALKLKEEVKVKESSFKLIDDNNERVTLFSHKVNNKDSVYESNARANLDVKGSANIDNISTLSSDVSLNNANINKIETSTTKLNNRINENEYKGGLGLSGSIGLNGISAKVGIDIQNVNTKGTESIHENSKVKLGGNSVINEKAKFISTDLSYDNLDINAKEVLFDSNKDVSDITKNTTNVSLSLGANATSPIVNDILKIGKGISNLTQGRIDKALSNVSNGFVGVVNDLSSNINLNGRVARKSDLGKARLEKDTSGYLNVSADISLNVGNINEKIHKEEVKSGSLTGGKLNFNNNKEVKFVSTDIKDTNISYNNVDSVVKDVKVSNNTHDINEARVGLGLGVSLDTKKLTATPGSINISAKGSTDSIKENINKLNTLTNTIENYNNVKDVTLRGVKSENSTLKGNISNLTIEDVKDEVTRKKVGVGADVSLSFTGVPTGGNAEFEFIDKREETVQKSNVVLDNLNVENISKKELEENDHNYEVGLRFGTSGVSGNLNINDKIKLEGDISSATISAIANPEEFKTKVELAKDEVVTTVKGIKTSLETSNAKSDSSIDISEKERTSILQGGNYHLNAKYDNNLEVIRNESAKTKEERKQLAQEVGFADYKVLDPDNLPKEIIERNKELEEKGFGSVRIFVDENNIVYTVGDFTEEDFKRGLAREYGINNYGRYTEDGKLLGATAGDIFAEQVKGSGDSIEETKLEADVVNDGEIGRVVSDYRNPEEINKEIKERLENKLNDIKRLLDNNQLTLKEERILKEYLLDDIKYYSARNQIVEWKKVLDFFEDEIDYSSKEKFIKSFEKTRNDYYKEKGNYISYSEILYLLGNKIKELKNIGLLNSGDNLGENVQYVKTFKDGKDRTTYEKINKSTNNYVVDPKLMSEDYKFLLTEQKAVINLLFKKSYQTELNDGTKIIKGELKQKEDSVKIEGDMEKMLGIKNGSIRVYAESVNVLGFGNGSSILKRIIENNFKISKEEKIKTELRNTELNVMVIENYDTGEIKTKTYVLDRMAEALDLNYFSSSNTNNLNEKKYDLTSSNLFEIVTVLEEKLFKNKEEYFKYVRTLEIPKSAK